MCLDYIFMSYLRNWTRFPTDFMFQLTKEETYSLKFQIGMSKKSSRGGSRYLPYAFTERGMIMVVNIMNSGLTIAVDINVVRSPISPHQKVFLFVRVPEVLSEGSWVTSASCDIEQLQLAYCFLLMHTQQLSVFCLCTR